MNHIQILKRAWAILWSYRALWLIGILLALTAPSNPMPRDNFTWQESGRDFTDGEGLFTPPPEIRLRLEQLAESWRWYTPQQFFDQMLPLMIALICIILLVSVVFAILRYVTTTSLVDMVDRYEQTGEKLTWRQGLRLGWSPRAWRLFLIDLLIYLPLTLVLLVLFGCAALPVLSGVLAGRDPSVPGIIAAVGVFFVVIFLAVILNIVLSLFLEMIRRKAVIEGLGVLDSVRTGWQFVIKHFKDVFLMWLVVVGINVGMFILVIPLMLLLVVAGVLVGGGFGLAAYAIFNAASGVTAAWIAALTVGLLLFILVLSLPMLFVNGLKETYLSSVWTLTYRELRGLAPAAPVELVELPAANV